MGGFERRTAEGATAMGIALDQARICDAPGLEGLKLRYEAQRARLPKALEQLQAWRTEGLPHFWIPYDRDGLTASFEKASPVLQGADDIVLLGIGGSSLGAQALAQLTFWGTPAYAPRSAPRLHVWENLDPATLARALETAQRPGTRYVVISKSGSTTETMIQVLALKSLLSDADARSRMIAIVEPGDSALRRFASGLGLVTLDHDPKLGGRYSVLSHVGLLPAHAIGLDVFAIRAGAGNALNTCLTEGPASAPAEAAAMSVAAAECGFSQSVLFAYSDRLASLGMWWRQLWGESLGKQGRGTTPIRAMGPVDQHSQLQLYVDGPANKLFTFITLDDAGTGIRVPADGALHLGLEWLAGRRVQDVTAAQAGATAEALRLRAHPVRTITLSRLDEGMMGGLMMHLMLETLLTAALMGVNPFDQPGVEGGKVLTRRFLEQGQA